MRLAQASFASLSKTCTWVQGATESLGGTSGAFAIAFATCPAGTTVIAEGCSGFTSAAIGRSLLEGNTWVCHWRRIFTLSNPNEVAAQVNGCS